MVAIAGTRRLEHDARMHSAAALACPTRVAGALLLMLMASCTSYEVREPVGSPLPQPVAKPTTAIVPPPVADNTAPPSGGAQARREAGVHRAHSGETAYTVARRYGVDAYAVITANNLIPPFDLYEGQRVLIPGTTLSPSPAPQTEQADRRPPRPSVGPDEAPGQTASRAPQPEPPTRQAEGFDWPVQGSIISEFGPKGGGRYNDGINIAAPAGTPVRAAESGVVAYAGNEVRGFGNMLLIKHSNGWVTAYAHNQDLLVQRGERVRRGQAIARVGSSGSVDRPQLHFELRRGKQAVDPIRQLSRPSANARARESG